ncbi:O-antigen ligase family protein [Candidatus Woesearchaeota archaeon]|nr:O-antigen ligase family protein [Candidatus Woesearchaeota archaeon]
MKKESIATFLFVYFIAVVSLSLLFSSQARKVLILITFLVALPFFIMSIPGALLVYIGTRNLYFFLPRIPGLETIFGVGSFLLLIIILISILSRKWTNKELLNNKKVKAMMYIYLGLVIATILGDKGNLILKGGWKVFFLLTTGLSLLIYFSFNSKKIFVYSMIILIFSSLIIGIASFESLKQGFYQSKVKDYEPSGVAYSEEVKRMGLYTAEGYALFNSNSISSFFVVSIGLLIGLLQYTKKNIYKLISIGLIIFFIIATVNTASRTGILGILVIAFLLFFKGSNKNKLFAIVFIVFFFLMVPVGVEERLMGTGFFEAGGRWNAFKGGFIGIIKRPIGYGFGISSREFNYATSGSWSSVHNVYMGIGIELGIIGLVAFLYLLYFIYKDIQELKIKFKNKKEFSLINGFEIAFIVYLIITITGSIPWSQFRWVMIGMGMAIKNCFIGNEEKKLINKDRLKKP